MLRFSAAASPVFIVLASARCPGCLGLGVKGFRDSGLGVGFRVSGHCGHSQASGVFSLKGLLQKLSGFSMMLIPRLRLQDLRLQDHTQVRFRVRLHCGGLSIV